MKVGFIVLSFVRQVSLFSLFSGIRTRDVYRLTVEFSLNSVVLKLVREKLVWRVRCCWDLPENTLYIYIYIHTHNFKDKVRELVIPVKMVGAFQKDVLAALFRC